LLPTFIWDVWPTNKSLIELSIGNLTGKGLRNYEYNIGSLKYGRESGFSVDKNK